jgi:hypothetical protein
MFNLIYQRETIYKIRKKIVSFIDILDNLRYINKCAFSKVTQT